MNNAINYPAEEIVQAWQSEAALPALPAIEPFSLNSRPGAAIPWRLYRAGKAAAAYFGYKTIVGRVTLISFSVLIASVALVVTIARTQATPRTFDIPETFVQGNIPPSLAACEHLYNGFFSCRLDHNGEEVTAEFDVTSRSVSYTSKTIRKLTLGDLIVAWGAPDGISHYYQESIIIWGPRTAYFGVCTLQPSSSVDYLGYGFAERPSIPWRGFVSHIPECANER